MTETHRYLAIDRKTGDPLWVASLTTLRAALGGQAAAE